MDNYAAEGSGSDTGLKTMLSKMAILDIDALKSQGVDISMRQALELNALGLRCEAGKDSQIFAAPRVAFPGGGLILHEPTLQSNIWYEQYACEWWTGGSLKIALAWACANATRRKFFALHTREKYTRLCIEKWCAGLNVTEAQLDAAVDYVTTGGVPAVSVAGDQPAADAEDLTLQDVYESAVNELISAGLNLSREEMLLKPYRTIVDIFRRWQRSSVALAGGDTGKMKASSPRDYRRYVQYLKSLSAPPKEPENNVR